MPFEDGIKTVSGAICNIQDGAPKVGLESWQVTLPASLSGYSSLTCSHGGKNISSVSEYPTNPWDFWGTNFTDMVSFLNTLKSGTYTISFDFEVETVPDSGDIQYGLPFIRALVGGSYVNLTSYSISTASSVSVGDIFHVSASFTLTDERVGNVAYCYIYCDKKDVHSGSTGRGRYNLINVQIEVGSTATTYEPYTAPTTATALLGRTIYGGTADVVNGTGTDGYGYIVFDGSNDENWGGYSAYNGYYIDISDMKSGTRQDGVCNQLTCSKSTAQGQTDAFWLGAGNKRFYVIGVYDSMGNTLEAFRAYLANNPLILVYPLATHADFTFTPITAETPLGVSNWWSVGTSEISYHDNAHGFASVTVTKQAPDQADEVKTAYLHKVIFGGLVDVVQGKAESKNQLKVTGEKTTYTDIEYTVNENGQVIANGTATALRSFKVIKNGNPGFSFKKGVTYTLSGCPSGGSDRTYQLDLRTTNTVGSFYMNAKDYGNGVTFTPTEDAVAFPIILVKNGQVCDNLTFNPQIEISSSKSDFAPYFDPFSFPPISMETDEGENTLYADEGNSAIVYRKEST